MSLVEAPKKSQKTRIYEYLVVHRTASNHELHALMPPIYQIPTRIYELKDDGYNIVTTQDEKDRTKFYYTLKSKEDLFL